MFSFTKISKNKFKTTKKTLEKWSHLQPCVSGGYRLSREVLWLAWQQLDSRCTAWLDFEVGTWLGHTVLSVDLSRLLKMLVTLMTKGCLCLQLAFCKSSLLLSISLWFRVRMLLVCFPLWDLDNLSENINPSGVFHKSHSKGSPSASLGSCWKCCISAPEMSITGACSTAQQASAQPRNVPLIYPGCPSCILCIGTKKSCLICCESLQPHLCLAWT